MLPELCENRIEAGRITVGGLFGTFGHIEVTWDSENKDFRHACSSFFVAVILLKNEG